MRDRPATRSCLLAALVVWLATFAGAWLTQRHGLTFSPDAWQYWSGSVSILNGDGYVDGHGLVVLGWPPGYSIWLAGWQACFGVSVATVRLAECFALGWAAAMVCGWILLRLPRTAPKWPVVVAASAASLAAARGAGSERLMLALLFSALVGTELLRSARGLRLASLLLLVTVSCAGMGLVRHAALAFLPGMWFLLLRQGAGGWHRATAMLSVVVIGTSSAWLASRFALGQNSEGWFAEVHGFGSLLAAMASGINRGIAPWPFGLVLFAVALLSFGPLRSRASRMLGVAPDNLRHADIAGFLLVSLAGLLTMYLVVYVADLPGARFMRFASITIAVLLAGISGAVPAPRVRWLLLALVLLPNVVYAGKHLARGRLEETTRNEHGGVSFLTANSVLGPPGSAEQLRPDGHKRVPEPLFRWQRERLERGEGK